MRVTNRVRKSINIVWEVLNRLASEVVSSVKLWVPMFPSKLKFNSTILIVVNHWDLKGRLID